MMEGPLRDRKLKRKESLDSSLSNPFGQLDESLFLYLEDLDKAKSLKATQCDLVFV